MKVNGSTAPSAAFNVERNGASAIIKFYENVQEVVTEESVSYSWDEYRLERVWYASLEADIENNYSTWFNQAKLLDEQSNPPDLQQLRADVDFVMVLEGLK